jgi:hypothetical protein
MTQYRLSATEPPRLDGYVGLAVWPGCSLMARHHRCPPAQICHSLALGIESRRHQPALAIFRSTEERWGEK